MQLDLSQQIATLIRVLPNCCYRNAMLTLLTLPQCAGWQYIEGWIIPNEWPIEHGWLLSMDQEIVDPTLALFNQRYIHTRYFPGASFSRTQVAYFYQAEQLSMEIYLRPLSYQQRWSSNQHEEARRLAYACR